MRHEGIPAGKNYDKCTIHSENEKTSKDSFFFFFSITMYLVVLRRWHLQQQQICACERTGRRQWPPLEIHVHSWPEPVNGNSFGSKIFTDMITFRKSCLMMTRFNPMTGDHIREKWRHTGRMSCYGWSRDWTNSASRQGTSSISGNKIGKTRKDSSWEEGFGLDFNS